jgi:hypothetical protein
MQASTPPEASFLGLVRELREESKTLIRQEIQLVKTEISENISCFGRNATWLGVGGVIAYAGLIVFLGGLASLLAYAFQKAGMQSSMANFLGLGIVGLVVALLGFTFLMKALKAFKVASLAPEKTLQTLKELKLGEHGHEPTTSKPELRPSSNELQSKVDVTITRMEETTDELRERLTPRYVRQTVVTQIKTHPVVSGLIGASTGLLGFLLIRRRIRHARA